MSGQNKNGNTAEVMGAAAGAAVGTAAGVGGSVVVVSTAGSVAGLSAAGFTSGLATIGGGSMMAGVAVLSCGTVVLAAGAGYVGYRLVKRLRS